MKTLKQLTILVIILIQSIGFSQSKNSEVTSEKQEIISKNESSKQTVSDKNLDKFIGKFLLVEGNFILEIVRENDKMYIVTEFSKDQLLLTNETTLHEFTRGVDLELIADNKDALKFSQNGYVTIIKRVESKTQN